MQAVSGRESLLDHFIVMCDKGEYLSDYVGIYDTEAKARAVAKMHFNDTGEMTDVFQLVAPVEQDS